jgi:hypothetical protein
MSTTAISKFATKLSTKVIANPEKALATATAAVPVVVETVIAVTPIAIVGAAGYGLYRLVKAVTQ